MKRYIKSSTAEDVLEQAINFASRFKGSQVDKANHVIIIPFSKGTTEEDLMEPGMLGAWFRDNGFDVEFSTGDMEYTTKPEWMNYRGWVQSKGHSAMLRNRTIGKFTW